MPLLKHLALFSFNTFTLSNKYAFVNLLFKFSAYLTFAVHNDLQWEFISWIYFLQLATHSPLEITPPKWLLFPPLLACIPLFPLLSKIHSRLRFWAVQTCLNYWPSVGNKHVRIISQSSDLWLIHFKPTVNGVIRVIGVIGVSASWDFEGPNPFLKAFLGPFH